MNKVLNTGRLFDWVKELYNKTFRKAKSVETEATRIGTCDARFESPIDPKRNHAVRLAVMRLSLERPQ